MQTFVRFISLLTVILTFAACLQEQIIEQPMTDGFSLLELEGADSAFAFFNTILDKDIHFFGARLQPANTCTTRENSAAAQKDPEKALRNSFSRDVKIKTMRIMVATRRPTEVLKEIVFSLDTRTTDCDVLRAAQSTGAGEAEFCGTTLDHRDHLDKIMRFAGRGQSEQGPDHYYYGPNGNGRAQAVSKINA